MKNTIILQELARIRKSRRRCQPVHLVLALGLIATLSGCELFSLIMGTAGVASVTFSPPGGAYSAAQTVVLSSATPGALIRYTTDGSDPSETAGTQIASGASVTVSGSRTLKAIGYKPGLKASAVTSATYSIVGSARLTAFAITRITNPNVPSYRPATSLVPGTGGGTITAYMPGGSGSSINVTFAVSGGGHVTAGGTTITSPATIDLSAVRTVSAVDASGAEYVYSLDIAGTGLPSVYITTTSGLEVASNEAYEAGSVTIAGGTESYSAALANTAISISGRGNSTWGPDAPKKPYKFKFASKTAILDMPAAKKWVLLANYFDKTLIRNAVVMKAAETVFPSTMGFVPRMRFVDVYLNGACRGTYSLGDQVEVGTSRLNVGTSSATDVDTSYFMEVNKWIRDRDGGVAGKDYFITPKAGFVIEYKTPDAITDTPAAGEITPAQQAWLSSRIADIETKLQAGSGFGTLLDTESFIDWGIVEEYFRNTDSAFVSSVYLHRSAGGKLKIGPLWDFDLSSGNADEESISLRDFTGTEAISTKWYDWMMKSSYPETMAVRTAFIARWNAKKSAFKAAIEGAVTEYTALTARSAAQDALIWPLSTDRYPHAYTTGLSRAEYIRLFSEWLANRYSWLDNAITHSDF